MRGRTFLAVGSLVIAMTILASPAAADCPDPPRDCSSIINEIKEQFGGTTLSMGVYKADDQPNAAAFAGFDPGQGGGVLIVINATNGSNLTFTFPANPVGVTWQHGHVLVVDNPTADSYHVVPFIVQAPAFVIPFNVTDEDGNEASGTLVVTATDTEDTDVWTLVLLFAAGIALAAALVYFGARKKKA